jgi:hypothetical protein
VSNEPASTSWPDTWTEQDWRDFGRYGVCRCGRLRREHVVFDDAGTLTEVIAQCDAGHKIDFGDIF